MTDRDRLAAQGRAFVVSHPLEQLADHLDARFTALEDLLMATKAQIEQMLTDQSAAVTDYVGDVNAKLADLQARLDATVTDQAALAELRALTDDVMTRGTAITAAIKAADVGVDRPAPAQPPA